MATRRPEKAPGSESPLEEGKLFDYITGKSVKDTDKEKVRQRIARALIHEYGIAAEDIEPDFKLKVLGKNRKIDIAIFKSRAAPHEDQNLYRAVVPSRRSPRSAPRAPIACATRKRRAKSSSCSKP
jgi:type I restriction enzyme M protein